MSEPELYRRYGRDEAIAAFGSPHVARLLCDGQWVVLPDYVLCFTTVGEPPGPSHFASASRFCWAADRPYGVTGGEEFQRFLPEEVRAGRKKERRLRLFVRRPGEETFLYLGRLGPSHHYGTGCIGKNFGEAHFDLAPPLPSHVWASLGGLRLGDLDHAALDASLAKLDQPMSVQERLAVLRHVAEYWHGPIVPTDGILEDELRYRQLPVPLEWWYGLAGRRHGLVDGFNRLLGPAELKSDETGKAVFYCENQGVYLWATMLEGDDPPVWGRLNEQEVPWTEEGMTLSAFLIQMCLLEGLWQAPYGASAAWADERTLERVVAPLRPLPLPPWHWPAYPSRLWYGGGAFVAAVPNGEHQGRDGFSIWVGAKTEQPLAYLREIVTEGWEYVAC